MSLQLETRDYISIASLTITFLVVPFAAWSSKLLQRIDKSVDTDKLLKALDDMKRELMEHMANNYVTKKEFKRGKASRTSSQIKRPEG